MRPDLQGLSITRGEVKHLTGFDGTDDLKLDRIVSKVILLLYISKAAILGALFYSFILIIVLGLLSLIIPLNSSLVNPIAWVVFLVSEMLLILRYVAERRKYKYLRNILKEVIKYNRVVKLININDDLIDLGHEIEGVSDRKKVVIALRLTRDDLVRALKTERILRENKRLLARNPDLIVNNLGTLTALQVSEQASEKARLLNKTIQIAVGVQEEMRKLQNGR